jgi:hypothetical protein
MATAAPASFDLAPASFHLASVMAPGVSPPESPAAVASRFSTVRVPA